MVPDYSRVLPPGSYINVYDFNGTKALAAHLREVTSNFTVWARYMRHRYAPPPQEARVNPGAAAHSYCDVARYLMNAGRLRALATRAEPFARCVPKFKLKAQQ